MTARQVLVVDDEIGIRELLRDILQDEGYHVRLAENAADAQTWYYWTFGCQIVMASLCSKSGAIRAC